MRNFVGIPQSLTLFIQIDIEANSIYAVTSLIALLKSCDDDTLNVDPIALGKIHQTLNTNILNIWEILDDFIYIVKAKSALGVLKD